VSGLEELSREELIALVLRLREANAVLEERVRRLERLVSRNSGNSSMPPSSDDLPGRTKPGPKRVRAGAAGADTSVDGWITVAEHPCVRRPSSRWPGIGYPGESTLRGAHHRLCAHRQLRLVVSAEYLAGLNGVLER
jgi:Family of unknown function (DUF6444)